MADPRASVSFEGIAEETATFKIDNSTITFLATAAGGSASVGLAVTLSADGTVALAADAEAVIGKLLHVEESQHATVQIKGGMTLPGGTGASLTLGKKIVGDLLVSAKGYIREVNTAQAAELGVATGKILDASDTTAVQVML